MPVKYDKVLAESKALPLVFEAIAALTAADLLPDGALPNLREAQTLSVEHEGHVVGVLLFVVGRATFDVQLAYVEPSSRRMGFFREMVGCLNDIGEPIGVKHMTFPVSADNEQAADALEGLGASWSYVYRLDTE